MKASAAITALGALAQETRLGIFRLLVRHAPRGLPAGTNARGASRSAADTRPAALPEVVVSKPLVHYLDAQLGFLGQFSAVSKVELRAQVGGTLTGIFFQDGDIDAKECQHRATRSKAFASQFQQRKKPIFSLVAASAAAGLQIADRSASCPVRCSLQC